jgi:hypothetical protein
MSRVQPIIDSVEGGVAQGIEQLCEDAGLDFDALTREELEEIDNAIFTCELCGWTLPVDDRNDGESGDGLLCRECSEE